MTQEEKLEEAKRLYETANADQRYVLESLFPELKESEDERMMRVLIGGLKSYIDMYSEWYDGVSTSEIIAWLEKKVEQKLHVNDNAKEMFIKALERVEEQNNKGYKLTDCDKNSWWEDFKNYTFCTIEQNPADKVEPRFKVGDWVVSPTGVYWHIDRIENNRYEVTSDTGKCADWSLDTDLYHLWTIQDAKDGDVLNSMRVQATIIFKGFADDGKHILAYSALQKGIFIKEEMLWDRDFEPCPKNWNDELFSKMHEAGYEWDSEHKQLKKITQNPVIEMKTPEESLGVDSDTYNKIVDECVYGEQKSAWSEEDESHIRYLIECLEHCKKGVALTMTTSTSQEYINWLKSLKPQNTWKPSEEMLEALYRVIPENVMEKSEDEMLLDKLYQGLKYGKVLSEK